jgi:hypothetical protein
MKSQRGLKHVKSIQMASASSHVSETQFFIRVLECIYKTIILPVVLYECETWSVTLREEHRLRVFENRVLRIYGPKGDEVTGGWRKLHKEELHNFYSSNYN